MFTCLKFLCRTARRFLSSDPSCMDIVGSGLLTGITSNMFLCRRAIFIIRYPAQPTLNIAPFKRLSQAPLLCKIHRIPVKLYSLFYLDTALSSWKSGLKGNRLSKQFGKLWIIRILKYPTTFPRVHFYSRPAGDALLLSATLTLSILKLLSQMKSNSFLNKVAVVTGASSGKAFMRLDARHLR